jgi:hypothetical protein
LIQNSVDAVLELWELQKQHPELKDIELPDQDEDVLITVAKEEDGHWWLTCSDKGIGMTVDTVKDYFLKAGGSLRNSDTWKGSFQDDAGKSKVLRSGRFGVGLMAAFLLGDEILVSTRHALSPKRNGYAFTGKVEVYALELRGVDRPVGTEIRVRLSGKARDIVRVLEDGAPTPHELSSNWLRRTRWYQLEKPSLGFRQELVVLKGDNKYIPGPNSDIPNTWRRVYHSAYDDIQWAFLAKTSRTSNTVFANGIQVRGEIKVLSDNSRECDYLIFRCPTISVFDGNGNLPLDLRRDHLNFAEWEAKQSLTQAVMLDFAAYSLVSTPNVCRIPHRYAGLRPGTLFGPNPSSLLAPYGALLLDSWCIQESGINRVLFTWGIPPNALDSARPRSSVLQAPCDDCAFPTDLDNLTHRLGPFGSASYSDAGIAITQSLRDHLARRSSRSQLSDVFDSHALLRGDWIIWSPFPRFEVDDMNSMIVSIVDSVGGQHSSDALIIEVRPKESPKSSSLSLPAQAWRDYLGCHYIPYDLDERREKLKHAYENPELKPYIKLWEQYFREQKEKGEA